MDMRYTSGLVVAVLLIARPLALYLRMIEA
jgi:hypothetical protein